MNSLRISLFLLCLLPSACQQPTEQKSDKKTATRDTTAVQGAKPSTKASPAQLDSLRRLMRYPNPKDLAQALMQAFRNQDSTVYATLLPSQLELLETYTVAGYSFTQMQVKEADLRASYAPARQRAMRQFAKVLADGKGRGIDWKTTVLDSCSYVLTQNDSIIYAQPLQLFVHAGKQRFVLHTAKATRTIHGFRASFISVRWREGA